MKTLRELIHPPTYARARLHLGIGGVGTFVVLALIALAMGLPTRIFGPRGGDPYTDASLFAVWLTGVALLCLPFEYLGGYYLPRYFRRRHPVQSEWALSWVRGVLVLVVSMSLSGAFIAFAGRYGGHFGAVGGLGLMALLFMALQGPLAQLVGGMRTGRAPMDEVQEELRKLGVQPPQITLLESTDEGFTGGIVGLPTAESIVLPASWVGRFEPSTLALLITRRHIVVDRGLRAYGVAGALLWTLVAFAIASMLPGAGVSSVAALIGTTLWFGVLSFVGLLVLPTPSRQATLQADAWAVDGRPQDEEPLTEALRVLDGLSDDEPERPEEVERIFHPIPSLNLRLAALGNTPTGRGPWHLARMAIFFSIAGLNPLARLVHCNSGRPELWVLLPADG